MAPARAPVRREKKRAFPEEDPLRALWGREVLAPLGEGLEAALLVEAVQVGEAADHVSVDDDLGNGLPLGALYHRVPLRRAPTQTPKRSPRLRAPAIFNSVQGRIYGTLGALILLTLVIAGVVFFFLLGGYQDRLAASTLRQIGAPVYQSVVTPPGADFQPLEVSRQLTGNVASDPEVRLLFVNSQGIVLSEASPTPRFRGEQLDIDLTNAGDSSRTK